MVSEDELFNVCKKGCFAASALGYNALVESKGGLNQIAFQSAIGTRIDGDPHADMKLALYSTCIKFNEQVKPNGQ